MDSVNSTVFIRKPPPTSYMEQDLLYFKEVFLGQLFVGSYSERRYVSVLKEYRDVVVVNSEETDLCKRIDLIKKKLPSIKSDSSGIKWVGITSPNDIESFNSYRFWVKFKKLPFGHYWFQIRNIKHVEGEIIFCLKQIRKYAKPGRDTFPKEDKKNSNDGMKDSASFFRSFWNMSANEFLWEYSPKNSLKSIWLNFQAILLFVSPYVTWENLIYVSKVSCALTMAFLYGFILCIKYALEYLLRLVREVSGLISAFTPIIIQLIDFCTKLIGGFFILLAGISSKINQPSPQPKENKYYYVPFAHISKPDNVVPENWRARNERLKRELLYQGKY